MIIIPARLASTRFANKILTPINGLPMFIATANQVKDIDEVLIACDNESVLEIAKKYNFNAILTSTHHKSGTERINEAVNILGLNDDEIIINVQADEPFIESDIVAKLIKLTKEKVKTNEALISSCYKEISHNNANDPNLVKVILDKNEFAIYFSRSLIPYPREDFNGFLGHIGIYGYTKKSLNTYCLLESCEIENVEKLEQLRVLYYGFKIAMTRVETRSFGIDTQEDLKKALNFFGYN